jgi:hypothetical protein
MIDIDFSQLTLMTTPNYPLTAFLAALATTPPNESLPPVSPDLLTNTDEALDQASRQSQDIPFWQRFDTFHDQLVGGYTVKDRNKIIRPKGSSQASDDAAQVEDTNVSLSAEDTLGEILNHPNPPEKARQEFQNSKQDPLDWAMGITGWFI